MSLPYNVVRPKLTSICSATSFFFVYYLHILIMPEIHGRRLPFTICVFIEYLKTAIKYTFSFHPYFTSGSCKICFLSVRTISFRAFGSICHNNNKWKVHGRILFSWLSAFSRYIVKIRVEHNSCYIYMHIYVTHVQLWRKKHSKICSVPRTWKILQGECDSVHDGEPWTKSLNWRE